MVKLDINTDGEEHLFGDRVGLTPCDLIYLMDYLEKEYGIRFNESDIDGGKMYTLNGLANLICIKAKISA